MLTEQERKWLEERKKRTQHCDTCPNRVGYYELCSSCRSRSLYGLSLCPDYRDAAEFEARVAEKLTLKEPCPLPENADLDDCPYFTEDDGSAFLLDCLPRWRCACAHALLEPRHLKICRW